MRCSDMKINMDMKCVVIIQMCCSSYRCVAMVTDVLWWLRLCCGGYGCVVVVTDVLW